MLALYVGAAGLLLALARASQTVVKILNRASDSLDDEDPAEEVAASSTTKETYDFIIVGAGSSGTMVAERLSAQGHNVLLIEAGGQDAGPFFTVPMAALGFQATAHHWGYETEENDELLMKGSHWAPCDGVRGRPLIMCRGRVLGGSSSLNLCNYVRGHPKYSPHGRLAGRLTSCCPPSAPPSLSSASRQPRTWLLPRRCRRRRRRMPLPLRPP